MVAGVGVHVRLVAESLIRHSAPHLNHTVQGQSPSSVIGAFYYLRVVKCMYFDKPEQSEAIEMSRDTEIVISANGLLLVGLGLYPTALMAWCAAALLN